MNLLQILLILKARYKIILLTSLITVSTAAIISLKLPKAYSATTSILLNYKGVDPVTGVMIPAQLMTGYMATQTGIIKSRNVALRVVNKLGLTKGDKVEEQFLKSTKGKGDINYWMADSLLGKLDVKPSKESSLLDITFTSPDPEKASLIANTFADSYQQASIELKIDPAQKAASYFSTQLKTLKDNLEKAQAKLSKYMHDNGITNLDQSLDIENMRLNELSSQLNEIQATLIDAKSRKSAVKSADSDSPDIANNPVVQRLRLDVATTESKVAEMQHQLGQNHPQFQTAKVQLDKIKGQLQTEIKRASNNIRSTSNITQQRETELQVQVDAQKKIVLELNRTRDEATLLRKDVETSQKAIDSVMQRFSQTRIEGESNQSEIAILNTAIPPLYPSSPRIMLNIIFAGFMGGIIGIGLGFLAEIFDRRVRCQADIVNLLDVPVFAIIDYKSEKTNSNLHADNKRLSSR